MRMKSLIAVAASMLIASPALSQVKPCEELKSEIEAKIKANGVPAFTLDIVPNEQVKEGEGKVVGTCDGSTQKRSEEHTSELQSPCNLVCRLLLEKKKKRRKHVHSQHLSKQDDMS